MDEEFDIVGVSSWLDRAADQLDKLAGLPSTMLVLITCLGIGWLLKAWKKFPNAAIPVVVILWSIVFNFCTMRQNVEARPVLEWRARNVMIGFAIGLVAWGLHYWVLYRLENIPWLNRILNGKNSDADTSAPLTK